MPSELLASKKVTILTIILEITMNSRVTTAVGVAKLKASLSAYLARVKAGQSVLVTEHGRPIARLIPVDPAIDGDDAHLAALESAGLVTRGGGGLAEALSSLDLPIDSKGLSLVTLLDEREQGR